VEDLLRRGLEIIREDGGAEALEDPEGIAALLERYMAEIELFNPAWGLVGARDRRELVVKHILDSLAPLGILRRLFPRRGGAEPYRAADAGSGAGLPGIPLALCLPDLRFTLIERMSRRAGFLRNTLAVLGSGNAEGPGNAEVWETDLARAEPGFDLVVFRALGTLDPALFRALLRLLKPGGCLAAYKGRREKAQAELAALGPLPERCSTETLPYAVPFLTGERCLLLVKKA
jgi:16S rRNA (guanine527-N7)-methyltransferase